MKQRDYWSLLTEDSTTHKNTALYQMGPQSHRLYLLDLLSGNNKDFPEYTPVRSLLDVGCGTAPIYDLLRNDRGKPDPKWGILEKYKGVDPSEAMIESCKYNFPDGDFEVQYGENLKEENNSWDCLLYMHALDYIYEYKKAIAEMHRVTRNYVCIVLWRGIDYANGNSHKLNNSVNGRENVDWSTARGQECNWPQLSRELEKAGFEILLKKDDEEINKEGRHNFLILLKKI